MGKIILGSEEKTDILDKLTSELQSTKFMTIRYLATSIDNDEIDLDELKSEDPAFIRDFSSILLHMVVDSKELPLVKKEAQSMLNKLGDDMDNRNVIEVSSGDGVENVNTQKNSSGSNIKCPSCMNDVSSNFTFCPSCGYNLVEGKCPNCKENIEANWKICPHCGNRLKPE
ncbi:MAG: zinc ribbon domain-containing protein [Halobacteriota archaeon]|nr:zinc ribbon domain-containing protein [Halobacteriota archaeon]